jgi:hypothetical protein
LNVLLQTGHQKMLYGFYGSTVVLFIWVFVQRVRNVLALDGSLGRVPIEAQKLVL